MRILIDEENYSWDKAWNITQNTCAYTNHTILVEALEKWPVKYIKELLPRIYSIIEVINTQFKQQLLQKYSLNEASVNSLAIINNGIIHMAHLCIVGSFSVNGVAELHTKILRSVEMKAFNEIFPHKFNNKTNGVTHRRWLYHCNPELSAFLNKYIGSNWVKNINELSKLKQFVFDKQIKSEFYQLKQKRKQKLSDLIYQKEGVKLNVDSIFDVQVKRLHEYKRQLMNALHIMHLYNKLKTDKEFYHNFYPQSFIFGAKAAGSYVMAKKIIKLINTISEIVNHDDEVNEKLKVVFVENYNVSYAELIMPAANVSEQISTASKEASGTGNMKFMMNGALTLGTLDGANVEIYELVGSDNIFIFGMTADEVSNHYVNNDYNPRDIYNSEPIVKEVVDNLVNGFFKNVPKAEFKMIYDDLLTKDYFFVLKDFKSYLLAQRQVNELYKNQDKWLEMALINIANSAYFSSDRTISQYAQEIWNLDKITF
jgi:starch phosphorylase